MTSGIVATKDELRHLVDAYATLGDEKKITDQMKLFTPDVIYKVYMNGQLVSTVSGTKEMETVFKGHASEVKTYFTLNGQHNVEVHGDTATGVSFSQIKMIRVSEGKDVLSDYSVRYDDKYVNQDGKWFIKERIGHFIIVEVRPMIS